MPRKNFDLTNDHKPANEGDGGKARRFVGIQFACCNVYTRIYVNREETAYVGYCPKCSKRVSMTIGPGGTDNRFFTAY